MSYAVKAEALAKALAKAILVLVDGGVDDSHCYRNLVDNLYAYRVPSLFLVRKPSLSSLGAGILFVFSAHQSKFESTFSLPHQVPAFWFYLLLANVFSAL